MLGLREMARRGGRSAQPTMIRISNQIVSVPGKHEPPGCEPAIGGPDDTSEIVRVASGSSVWNVRRSGRECKA
jgi:hypothetical protein